MWWGGFKWFTSAFMPRILEGAPAAPRRKAPGSSSSFDTLFMSYSWEGGGGRQCMIIPFTTGHCSLSPKKKYLVFLNQGDQVRHTTNISDARTSTQAYSVRTEVTVRETHWVEIKHANVYIVCKLNLPIYKSKFNSTSNRCSISPCRAPVTCLLF